MSIQVNDFRWEPGKNDAEYIKLLESSRNEWQKIAQKAIAKLKALSKAQEPLVMTISDFNDEGVYYLEALPPFVLRPVIYRLDKSDPRHYNFVWKYDQFTWNTDEYGKTWRCWTSRPTDAQRKAIPWD